MDNGGLWVGKKEDQILVYDPKEQVIGSDLVLLWNKTKLALETHPKEILGQCVEQQILGYPTPVASEARELYSRWRQSNCIADGGNLMAHLSFKQRENALLKICPQSSA